METQGPVATDKMLLTYNQRFFRLMESHEFKQLTDEEMKTATKYELVWSHIPLAIRFAIDFCKKGGNFGRKTYVEDAASASFIGLIEAAESYDPERGKFSTIAYWHMKRAVQDLIRRDGRPMTLPERYFRKDWTDTKMVGFSLEAALRDGMGDGGDNRSKSLQDQLVDDKPIIEDTIDADKYREVINDVLSQLTPNEEEVLRHIFGFVEGGTSVNGGWQQNEIARKMGLSNQRIHQLLNSGMKRFKKIWKKKYDIDPMEAIECL